MPMSQQTTTSTQPKPHLSNMRGKIGILAAALTVNAATSAFTPALADLSASFPEVPQASVQMVLTIGALASMFGAMIAGKLQDYFPQKYVLAAGAFLQLLSATPLLFHDVFGYVYVVALFVGTGCGILTATIPAAITSNFEGQERAWMLGAKASLGGIGGTILTWVAGMLAVMGWQYAFGIYLFSGVIMVLIGLFMTSNKPMRTQRTDAAAQKVDESNKSKIASAFPVALFLCAASMTLMQSCISTNLAMHAQLHGLGGPDVSGFAYSLYSAGIIISGFVAPIIISHFPRQSLLIGYLSAFIGMALIGLAPNTLALCAGNLLNGIAYGAIFTRIFALLPEIVRTDLVPKAMSCSSVIASLGFAVGPMLFSGICAFIPSSTATTSFIIAAVMLLCILAALVLTNFETRALNKATNQ